MINNFEPIKSLLDFKPGDFYFIQVIKRRKDNPGLARDQKRVAEYYVYSMKYLEEHQEQIIEECTLNNARAYIHLNRRNAKKTAHKCDRIIAELMENGDYAAIKSAYTSACGKQHSDPIKKWIVDIDDDYVDREAEIKLYIRSMQQPNNTILVSLDTKNGVHLITQPFRKDKFNTVFPNLGLKPDSPTVLFIP